MPQIRIGPAQTFTAEASIPVPGAEEPALVEIEFRALTLVRVRSMLVLLRALERNRIVRAWEYLKLCWRLKRLASMVDLLDEVIVGWSGAIDAEYSPRALRTLLLEYPGAGVGIFAAYLKGRSEALRKN